jgi:PPOX class F420-dependent enzyme/OxyR family protein
MRRTEEEATDMRASLTPEELEYLTGERRLGRLATVQPDGFPHAVPVGWRYNADLGTIDISGLNFAATKKFRNVAANPKVAFVVDDVLPPWRPRSVMIQGSAEALEAPESGEALIRITPRNVISWGLESAK